MHISFWRPPLKGRAATKQLVAGAAILVLVVGVLAASVLLSQHATAAPRQQHTTRVSLQAQSTTSTRLETFTVSQGLVYHRWSDDGGASWSAWTSLSGLGNGHSFTGTPAVVSDGVARLNVFARDSLDNVVYVNTYNNGPWSGWSVIPGLSALPATINGVPAAAGAFGNVTNSSDLWFINSDPAVTSWGPGRREVFIYGINASGNIALMHTWGDNYGWSNKWEVLGTGSMQGNPTAVSWGTGRDDVFVRGGGNELDHKWFANGSWSSGWENLGTPSSTITLTSSPSVASPGSGRLNIFARASDGHLWGIWFAGGWGGWGDVGCCLAGDVTSSVAATSKAPLTLDVFVIGTDHALYRKTYDASVGGWSLWQFIDHTFDYTGIATTAWVQNPPPPPATPTPTFSPRCGIPGQPPCPVTP